jgi:hypothetical protein
MAAFLPIVVLFLLCWMIICRENLGLRLSVLISAIFCGCYLAAVTESLSLAHAITPLAVLAAWTAPACACLIWILIHGREMRDVFLRVRLRSTALLKRLDRVEWICLIGIAAAVAATGLTALLSPPNTGDAMDYHMPRVSEWILRRSVGLFPTHYLAQHFYLLAGDDRFSNLVQWFNYGGSILAVSLVAKLLGGNQRSQVVSALLCATLPQGVLAASGAKNDWTATFWLVVSCVFLLRWCRAEEPRWRDALLAGLALGLAVLTKGTTYLFAPFILLGCLGSIQRRPMLRRAWQLAFLPLLVVLLNAPQYARNYELSGSPIGFSSPNGDAYEVWRCTSYTPQRIAANVIRNAALHLGTRSNRVNGTITNVLAAGIRMLGVDPNDPATTWSNSPFRVNAYSVDEFFAGNPLHLLLIVCATAWILWRWRHFSRAQVCFMLGVIGAYVLFCAMIPFSRWAARLHLAPFALGCAVVGIVLVQEWRRLAMPVVVLTMLAALPDALVNVNRPLLGFKGNASVLRATNEDLYFADQRQRESPYHAAEAEIRRRGCRIIGVDSSQDVEQFEYPLFEAFPSLKGFYSIRDTGVQNVSARFVSPVDRSAPCAVICLACATSEQKMHQYLAQLPTVKELPGLVVFEAQRR